MSSPAGIRDASRAAADMSASDIESRVRFDMIRYANCWEDADILCEALRPGPGMRVLSIASGGDNAFAIAAEGAEVVAADLSFAQFALVELKRAALKRLDYEDVLAFMGVRPSDDRRSTYERLETELPGDVRAFWRGRLADIAHGVVHAGKFEAYFRLFRTRIVPLIHTKLTVRRLLAEKDAAARERFYRGIWDNLRWRMMFRAFFSRFVMGRLGRDPEFFRYVEGSVSERILSRTRYAFTVLPTHENPYLDYIFTGNFPRMLPRYLRRERFDSVREGAERLVLHHGPIQEAAQANNAGGFHGFNLSDIFEYLDLETCASIYRELLDVARSGARFAYWNMLAPRRCPQELAARVRPLHRLSTRLFQQDRAFFYSAFVVEEVR